MKAFAVILAGGKGERFWPKSRRTMPKQFLKLFGKRSLVQLTADRIASVCPLRRQRFVTDAQLGQVLKQQLKLSAANLVYEPYGRNTAPAIALAAVRLAREAPDALMVVLPADHLIADTRSFQAAVRVALELAEKGYLVTFGIPPKRPDTNYGYVEVAERIYREKRHQAFAVRSFREKPVMQQARKFVRAGNFLWNSGMFVWRADVFLHAVAEFMPEFYPRLMKYQSQIGTKREWQALRRLYAHAPVQSVDYAIMEKSRKVAVVKAHFDWDDVGSWLALERHFPPDADGNTIVGLGKQLWAKNCLTFSDTGLIALVGCQDLIVVQTDDAVLVCRKDYAGEIKNLLAQISADQKLAQYL